MGSRPRAVDDRPMQEHCVVLSLLPGRGESARDFMRQLTDGRRAEQERSERRIGISGERWFVAQASGGELLICLIDSDDLARAIGLLSVSMEPHDLWFKRGLAEVTGVDLNESIELPVATLLSGPRAAPRGPDLSAAPPRALGSVAPVATRPTS